MPELTFDIIQQAESHTPDPDLKIAISDRIYLEYLISGRTVWSSEEIKQLIRNIWDQEKYYS